MAMTAQEKIDAKREKEYNKKHKRMYKLKPGDIVFNILNYAFFILFTITCIDGCCICFRWLSGNKAGNVAQKSVVSCNRNYNVLQRRFDRYIPQPGNAGSDKPLYGLYHSRYRSSLQHYPG